MDKKRAKNYIGKKVKIILKNGYKYAGKVVEIDEDTLVIQDWKVGEVDLDIPSISVVNLEVQR